MMFIKILVASPKKLKHNMKAHIVGIYVRGRRPGFVKYLIGVAINGCKKEKEEKEEIKMVSLTFEYSYIDQL